MSKIFRKVIRVSKEASAFTYFQLEANEGLAFYSTLPHVQGDQHRDLEICGSITTLKEVENLILSLARQFPVEILKEEIIEDTHE